MDKADNQQMLIEKAIQRNRIDITLTGVTAALFIGFLAIIIGSPKTLSALTIIAVGFGLILYSVVATIFYDRWISRVEEDDKHDATQGGGTV